MPENDGLFAIAAAIDGLTRAIDRLGNADAATPMGAIEALGKRLGEAIDDINTCPIADALDGLSETLEKGMQRLADGLAVVGM